MRKRRRSEDSNRIYGRPEPIQYQVRNRFTALIFSMLARMKKFLFIASGLVLLFLAEQVQAQNVIRDYVLDKHENYQPDDHVNRGLIYRMQTGHAGFFKNCDGDLDKMYSPYINWNCRPGSPPRPVSNSVRDFDRKLTRFRDGAGGCTIHSTETRDSDLSAYEVVDEASQVAADRLTPETAEHLERHILGQPRGSRQMPARINDLSAERVEQLRIQQMHR